MYDFDSLVEEVLKNKPELSRNSLMEQIEEKKNTVGSGYLTNQGALFLIAG
ncbi:MAG: single-stranded DNA-binding protein, partial [Thaumarchaeota archaeon]